MKSSIEALILKSAKSRQINKQKKWQGSLDIYLMLLE